MHTDKIYGRYLDEAALCGQVVKMGSDSAHVTPVASITDIPYGVVLGPEAQDLSAGHFADIGLDGELPCIAGAGGVTAKGWVVASAGGAVIDLPEELEAETTVVALGQALDDAVAGDEVLVRILPVALTIPAAS